MFGVGDWGNVWRYMIPHLILTKYSCLIQLYFSVINTYTINTYTETLTETFVCFITRVALGSGNFPKNPHVRRSVCLFL